MADEEVMYGYEDDEVKVSPFVFGLNAGKTFLTKFEWIPNGGKEGAEQEALEIVFTINDTVRGYRMFPVTQAFGKNSEVITDRAAPEFKDAVKDFNARITHILSAFQGHDAVKAALSVPAKGGFKGYCELCRNILPKDFATTPLDIFLQYQWQIPSGKSRTYLEIPRKMKYGRWLTKAVPGTWVELKKSNPDDNDQKALVYGKKETAKLDAEGKPVEFTEFHPFTKNGWFMNSNFAQQQKDETASANDANVSGGSDTQAITDAEVISTTVGGAAPAPTQW